MLSTSLSSLSAENLRSQYIHFFVTHLVLLTNDLLDTQLGSLALLSEINHVFLVVMTASNIYE